MLNHLTLAIILITLGSSDNGQAFKGKRDNDNDSIILLKDLSKFHTLGHTPGLLKAYDQFSQFYAFQ